MAYTTADNNEYDPEYLPWRGVFEMTHCKIVNAGKFIRATYVDEERTILKTYEFCSENDMKKSYKHINYTKTGEDGKPKTVTFINAWLTDINIRRYDDYECVPPPLFCPPTVFNLWRASPFYGQDIKPSSDNWTQSAVDKFLTQVNVLCNNEDDTADYVMKWMAHLIQKPYEKSTHLCFTSIQGTGKSLTFSVLKKIIGGGSFESTTPGRDVWGNFNSPLMDNMLIILSEVNHRTQANTAEAKFKALITDEEVPVNQKYKALTVMKSYHRFVTLTNEPDPIKLTVDDRRHMLALCSPEKKKDLAYFADFDAEFRSRDSLLTLYSYLNSLDIVEWDARNIPKTKYHLRLLKVNRDPIDEFFEWWVVSQILGNTMIPSGEYNAGCVEAYGKEVFKSYEIYKSNNGNLPSYTTGSLVKYIMYQLALPQNAIREGKRDKNAQSRIYDIAILKKHYKIGKVVVSPSSFPGRAESADVVIGGSPWSSPQPPLLSTNIQPKKLFAAGAGAGDDDVPLKDLNDDGEEEIISKNEDNDKDKSIDDLESALQFTDFFNDGLKDLNSQGEEGEKDDASTEWESADSDDNSGDNSDTKALPPTTLGDSKED